MVVNKVGTTFVKLTLKGLDHEIELSKFCQKLIVQGLNKNLYKFLDLWADSLMIAFAISRH